MLRFWFWPLLAFAAMLLPGSAPAQQAPSRIVAVGDLHGDYDAWEAIARAAGLVDAKGKWSGGNTVLVQLGDVVDRGPDSLKIVHQLMKLQKEAPKKGGRVIALVGNHEAMNMIGDLRYVHPGEYQAFVDRDSVARRDRAYEANKPKIEAAYRARTPTMDAATVRSEWMKATPLGMLEHQIAWRPDGEVGRWVVGNPAVVKLGGTLFVHGGISATYTAIAIDEINRRVANDLKRQDEAPTATINDPRGPLWYRGLILRGADDPATQAPIDPKSGFALPIDQEINLVLASFAVKRIVVGHTPSLKGIIEDDKGRLWRADSAISRAYNGKLAYLEIMGDRVTTHEVQRPAGKAWGTTP